MTVGAQCGRPVTPSSARCRCLDAFEVASGQLATSMKGVGRTFLPSLEWRNLSQGVSHGPMLARRMSRRNELNRTQTRCHDDEPAPMLRDPIVLTVNDP